jgi:hypothetical protein
MLLGTAGSLAAGCGDDPPGECQRDIDCPGGRLCVARSCVASLGTGTAVWSLELVPPAQSRFALREHAEVSFTAAPVALAVDTKVGVNTILDRPQMEVVAGPAAVRVAFAVASSIPGRRELRFEVDSTSPGYMFPYDSQLALPQRLLGKQARLFVGPLAPVNRQMCPWQFDLVLESRKQLNLPGREETLVVEGMLLAPATANEALAEYEARVLLDERLASNLARTDASGRFLLRMQLSTAMRASGLRLELAPADSTAPLPSLVVSVPAVQPSVDLGELRMPAHPPAVMVTVPVTDESQRPVSGATVTFQLALPGAVGGEARYARSALTGADGRATLRLIPGVEGRPAPYLVKVVPPASGEAAARCLARYEVAGPVASGGTLVTEAVALPSKVALAGEVLRADGKPAAGMLVRATRRGDLIREGCAGELASPPSETTSDRAGRYRMLLDPGHYRLEYEPPPDSPLPLAMEPDVAVADAVARTFTLPAAVVIEGRVVTPPEDDGGPVSRTEVRAYGLDAEGSTRVHGSTTSGSDGRFRLVLPQP